MSQRATRHSTQISTKASLALQKQETVEPAVSAAALSLVTMQKQPSEIAKSSNSSSSSGSGSGSGTNTEAKPTEAKPAAAPQIQNQAFDAAKPFLCPPHPWRPFVPGSPSQGQRSRSRSRSRTRDLPPSPVKPAADASSADHSEAPEATVEALKGRLQNDINILFAWRQGMTNRLDGQNRKVDVSWATATEGVRLAKIAGVSASDAMTRADDAMNHAKDALTRAKNVFNTAVNEHGPSLRKIKDRVRDLETRVDDLDRETRAMSRTLIASSSSEADGRRHSESISAMQSDIRYLLREVDSLNASNRHCANHAVDSDASQDKLKEQVEALAKELASEKAKVAYLMHRDYVSSMAQPQVQVQQQPPHPQYAAYPYHPPPTAAAQPSATPAAQPQRIA